MKKALRIAFWVIFLAVPILLMLGGSGIIEIAIALIFGWFKFFNRTLPKLAWNWDLIGMALICIVLLLFFAHRFLTWIAKRIVATRGGEWRWPWKWTWCSLTTVLLLFFVGMSVGGTVHQIGWLASSPESLLESKSFRGMDMNNMKQIDLAFQMALEDAGGKLADVRKELWKPQSGYISQPTGAPAILQRYYLLVVVDEKKEVLGTIIFPRDPTLREKIGGLCSLEEENDYYPRSKKLSELIQKYQACLIAL